MELWVTWALCVASGTAVALCILWVVLGAYSSAIEIVHIPGLLGCGEVRYVLRGGGHYAYGYGAVDDTIMVNGIRLTRGMLKSRLGENPFNLSGGLSKRQLKELNRVFLDLI